jgi:hypothetical protein
MSKLFLWVPQGRLGNLIFQYQAVAALSGTHKVLTPGSEFFDLFEAPSRFVVIPLARRFRWKAQRMWTALVGALAARRWIGRIEPKTRAVLEGYTCESLELDVQEGRLRAVTAVRGFFQSAVYLDPLPRLKPHLRELAERTLAGIPQAQRVAVHMRFGDYARWPVFGVPGAACLPAGYYRAAVEVIRARVPDARFVVISDDAALACAVMRDAGVSADLRIASGLSAESDFTAIASCAHAIIAASSFSWWAATLIANPGRTLIAPEYWAGFSRRTWYPPDIRGAQFVYLDPNQCTHAATGVPGSIR